MHKTDQNVCIRKATLQDAALLTQIEAACFPAAEAATRDRFDARLEAFADHFLICEVDGEAVGFIDGMVIDSPYIEDVMFEKADRHCPDGAWQSIFGLNTLPKYRRRGYAARLMQALIAQAREEGRRGLTLTCKEHMLHYYAKFGFVPLGASDSQHGGARWFDMVLEFKPEIAVQPPVKAVLFDLDGTLVDSVPMLTAAVNRVMRANGCPEFTEAQIAAMVGRGAKALIESVCAAQGIEPTPENVQRFLQAYAAAMMGSGLPEEKFYPGAREAVAALQAAGFLDVLVAGDDTDHPKPAPDMLLLACEKLGVSPTEAVMVGDSENDAWAAKAAGIRAMLVSTGYNGTVPMTQWAKDNGFSLVFDSVAGIKDYIFACEGKFVS